MKGLLKNVLLGCVMTIIFSGAVFACSCGGEPLTDKSIDEIRKEKRNYFLNNFSGAAFVGKIVSRQRINVTWFAKTLDGKPAIYQMYKYTIRIKEYWFGVKSLTISIYGQPVEQIYGNFRTGNSCGFRLSIGKTYFFTPEFYEGHLKMGPCDFAGGASEPSDYAAKEFREIMGKPKRF